MKRELDHLMVAARTLEEGAAWVEAALGVKTLPGGKHPLMGTHNRVLSIGRGRYLEVIAIDPDAVPPGRARWFGLDDPAIRARLERGPVLLHWAERTDDLDAALRDYPERVEVLEATRGDLAWRITVPHDGHLPCAGACPTLIQWSGPHPTERMPPSGCELVDLSTKGPLEATFSTPSGRRTLPPQE